MSKSQKTVLITGCSAGGIGFALAQEFHRRGLRVIATARRLESMAELAAQGIETLELDVTNDDSVRKTRDAAAKLIGGKLDILVNNAGQGGITPATDLEIEKANAIFDVNLYGPMRMVKEFAAMLIASGDGRIVQIGSTAAVIPVPFSSVYNASKAALHAYSNTIRVELTPFNIKVIMVVSGAVGTNIWQPSSLPLDSIYRPMEEIHQARRKDLGKGVMEPSRYAKTVVSEALSTRPRASLWAGSYASVLWFLDTFFGRPLFDFIMIRRFGLKEFAAMIKEGKGKAA
ncbi:hypothetical protein PILCRDRAFT_812140 [Piloderma croceum F 1598]|uniref:Uncharacterized protein n=1 Tax=Piloderma croceum (strain F 1598) TaxID=765440 RepID=A0A0C3CL70_PILCF|nr:hypothetical protein PILCRDRAFT_812140 [Piloderma croceum F 1598]